MFMLIEPIGREGEAKKEFNTTPVDPALFGRRLKIRPSVGRLSRFDVVPSNEDVIPTSMVAGVLLGRGKGFEVRGEALDQCYLLIYIPFLYLVRISRSLEGQSAPFNCRLNLFA